MTGARAYEASYTDEELHSIFRGEQPPVGLRLLIPRRTSLSHREVRGFSTLVNVQGAP
jgi:hypothetical protein